MIIDTHSHVFAPEYLELFARPQQPTVATRSGRDWHISYSDTQKFVLSEDAYHPAGKLERMDRLGIDVAVLSTNIPGPELLPPELSAEGARRINDHIADVMGRYPGRFAGLASLPWGSPPEALSELERAMDDLGHSGAVLYSHVSGRQVDDSLFEPIYAALAQRGAPLVFHPTVPAWGEAIKDHSMITMLGLQVDTSFALLRLILSGVLERHPSLKVVMPHAGGILPYMIGRIDHQTETLGRGREHINRPPSSFLREVYLDSVTPSAQTLRFAYEFAGQHRLLFGTDDPWVDSELLLQALEALELPDAEREAVCSGNARALFGLGG